ncbi:MAG: hypothetical protein H0U10_10410, partial [Chloroflexia bacterium]|nr:hypothetical protein [Chloroflexia bacterium]
MLVVSALVARRAVLLGPLPPGLDGGQWLAIGRGLLGGEGRSTPGAYAPLVPLMAASLAGLLDPIAAVRLVALGSYLFVVVASAVAAGSMFGAISGAAVAAAVGSAGAVNEPLAFGGYPQQVALAALIVAGWAAARLCWVDGDERQGLWLLGAGLAVAALAHHVYYPLTLAVVGCICGLALLARSSVVRTVVVRIAAVSAASTLLALPTLVTFLRVGYAPPLDAVALSVVGAWGYGTREAPIFWLGTIMAGAAALLLTPGGSRGSAWTFAGAALTIGGASFLLSGEPRMLPVLLVGGLFGVASGLRLTLDGPHPQPPVSVARERGVRRLRSGLPAVVVVLIAALLVLPGDRATRDYLDFYRVLDP